MPRKQIRKKRKASAIELTGMAKVLLYHDILNHLEGTKKLSAAQIATLEELKKTPAQFMADICAEWEENEKNRPLVWIDQYSRIYAQDPNQHTAAKLREYLIMAGIEPDEYFRKHFPKRIIDFATIKDSKNKR